VEVAAVYAGSYGSLVGLGIHGGEGQGPMKDYGRKPMDPPTIQELLAKRQRRAGHPNPVSGSAGGRLGDGAARPADDKVGDVLSLDLRSVHGLIQASSEGRDGHQAVELF
jgi:hypothetical protein